MSTWDSLSLLWIQVTEGDSVERVVSSEEEPMVQTLDRQRVSVEVTAQATFSSSVAAVGQHTLSLMTKITWAAHTGDISNAQRQMCQKNISQMLQVRKRRKKLALRDEKWGYLGGGRLERA